MSDSSLDKFLTVLDEELSRSTTEFRQQKVNVKPSVFVFNKVSLVSEILKQISKVNGLSKSDVKIKDLEKGVRDIVAKESAEFIKELKSYYPAGAKRTGGRYELLFADKGDLEDIDIARFPNVVPKNKFNTVKRFYSQTLDAIFYSLNEFIATKDFDKLKGTPKQNFNAGHGSTSGVIELKLRTAIDTALAAVSSDTSEQERVLRDAKRLLLGSKSRELTYTIKKITNISKVPYIEIAIESSRFNQLKGAQSGKVSKSVTRALTKLNVSELKGSDSLTSFKKKEILRHLDKEFKKLRNVKITLENTKVESSKPKKKKVKRKATKISGSTTRASYKKKSTGTTARKGASSQPFNRIKEFNTKLRVAVARNMEEPALRYQTGRFASSVRVLRSRTTEKGFLSFDYTYQTYPYQTFEPGYAQGTRARDPRRLIEESMRDIARDFAIGRFYARRVYS